MSLIGEERKAAREGPGAKKKKEKRHQGGRKEEREETPDSKNPALLAASSFSPPSQGSSLFLPSRYLILSFSLRTFASSPLLLGFCFPCLLLLEPFLGFSL